MSKTLFTLLIIFFLTFASFLYIEFFYLKNETLQAIFSDHLPSGSLVTKPARNASDSVAGGANLSFSPNPLTTSATSSAQINVVIQTNTSPNLIQLEIGFDPNALYNVNITSGDYLLNPEVVLYNVDIKNGRISYGLTGEPNPNNAKTVAVITFNTYNYGVQKETSLFFPPKTLVRKDGEEIKLNSVGTAKIIY